MFWAISVSRPWWQKSSSVLKKFRENLFVTLDILIHFCYIYREWEGNITSYWKWDWARIRCVGSIDINVLIKYQSGTQSYIVWIKRYGSRTCSLPKKVLIWKLSMYCRTYFLVLSGLCNPRSRIWSASEENLQFLIFSQNVSPFISTFFVAARRTRWTFLVCIRGKSVTATLWIHTEGVLLAVPATDAKSSCGKVHLQIPSGYNILGCYNEQILWFFGRPFFPSKTLCSPLDYFTCTGSSLLEDIN
jgi:hypothetical protein